MKVLRSSLFFVFLMLLVVGMGVTSAQDKPYAGVTVRILSFDGPAVTEPLLRRGPDFEALTGAKIEVTTVPFADLFNKIQTDQATGTNSYDAFILAPQWHADLIVPGYLEDLTERVNNDKDIQWGDIGPFFQNYISSYEGKIYTIPLDGDLHTVYYRTDVFKDNNLTPPTTWEDYLKVAAALNGKDLNGDGNADYGSCIPKKRGGQGYWWVLDIASGYIQSQGTAQGMFFNTDDMTPLVKNDGFIRALEIYNETTKYGPPDELNLDLNSTRSLFLTGRCALTIDWGDIGSLSIDPKQSTVQDKVGTLLNPGSTEVVDRATGKLVPCDEKTCPYAIDGVNHAPLAAFGGWGGSVSAAAKPEVKDAAYAFFSYLSQPKQSGEDVTMGKTGYNPYRASQFASLDTWVKAGFSETAAKNYLSAIEASVSSPNMVLDLSIPQVSRYQQVVLDTVVSQFLAGEFTAEQAADEIYKQSEEITDEVGRDAQKAAYLASLGISTK